MKKMNPVTALSFTGGVISFEAPESPHGIRVVVTHKDCDLPTFVGTIDGFKDPKKIEFELLALEQQKDMLLTAGDYIVTVVVLGNGKDDSDSDPVTTEIKDVDLSFAVSHELRRLHGMIEQCRSGSATMESSLKNKLASDIESRVKSFEETFKVIADAKIQAALKSSGLLNVNKELEDAGKAFKELQKQFEELKNRPATIIERREPPVTAAPQQLSEHHLIVGKFAAVLITLIIVAGLCYLISTSKNNASSAQTSSAPATGSNISVVETNGANSYHVTVTSSVNPATNGSSVSQVGMTIGGNATIMGTNITVNGPTINSIVMPEASVVITNIIIQVPDEQAPSEEPQKLETGYRAEEVTQASFQRPVTVGVIRPRLVGMAVEEYQVFAIGGSYNPPRQTIRYEQPCRLPTPCHPAVQVCDMPCPRQQVVQCGPPRQQVAQCPPRPQPQYHRGNGNRRRG